MNERIEEALRIVIDKLNGLNYALIGSVNLFIQGIDLLPRDIDILTDSDGIEKIVEVLKEYQTKEVYFEINGVEVEVLGNVDNKCRPGDSLDKKILIDYKDMKIPCISLKEELEVYERMGREDKVKLIREKLGK